MLVNGVSELRDLVGTLEGEGCSLRETVSRIREKACGILDKTGLRYEVKVDVAEKDLQISPLVKLNMLRIMQESLNNVLKHAKAGKVEVTLLERDGKIALNIKDDGKGFDPTTIESKGYGLRNVRQRCEEMGGMLNIKSEPPKFTEIEVSIPLPQPLRGT